MSSLLYNAIDRLGITVEFADQDWSRVPSTPKFVLCKQDNISAFLLKESNQLISKAFSITEQSIAVNERTNHIETENCSSAVESPSGPKTVSESIESSRASQKASVAQSTVPTAPKTPLCKQKNASGISRAACSLKNSKQLIPRARAKKKVLTPKLSDAIWIKRNIPKNKPRLSAASKKKKAMLMAHGLPEQIATDLCVLTLTDLIERTPSLKAVYPNIQAEHLKQVLQAVNGPKTQIGFGTDKPNPIDTAPLRVGIQNSEPMIKEQMTKVHRHLILAIAEQWNDGSGPEFLEFKHMDGWIMVTCVDQRSKAWLLDELQYLEPWPESQLSIMPERKLPKVNTAKIIAFIPGSEASSVPEALELLKAQNKGLNTEQWTIVNQKLESGKSWTVTFVIDEASLKTLEAQECRAAIGFSTMNFQIIPEADIHIKPENSSAAPPTIGYIKHMLQDAKDRIEEMKQKRLSDRRSRWGRWDEPPPSVLELQRMLEAKNRNTAQPITEDLRRREETSTSATAQVFSTPTAVALDRKAMGGITVIQQNFPALPAPANLGGFSAHATGRNPHMVPHSMEIPGFGVPNAAALGRIGTGGVTVPQQNSFTAGCEIGTNLGAFSAQVTGRNPNMMPHSMEIPGFGVPNATTLCGIGTGGFRIPQQNCFTAGSEIGTNLNAFSAQVTGRNLSMMPPNTVIPGFGVPNAAATMGESGIVTQQNIFSAPDSQTQEIDYFLGPGGGSQFVQNQMTSHNSVNYGGVPLGQKLSIGVGDAAYQQNIAPATYPYSNPPYYMNCYQDSQAAMSMLNQKSGQQGPVAQSSRNNNGSERGMDSSPTKELSEEGYRSWIIEETKRFDSNLEDHSSLASTGALSPTPSPPTPPPPPTPSPPPPPIISNYRAPMDQDPDRWSPFDQNSKGTYQDMHSRSYMERLSTQARDLDSPNHRRRSYDRDSISRFDRLQSPQAESDRDIRDSDIEDYESYKRSQSIREIKEEQVSLSHEFRSPERRSGCKHQNIEDSESYESSWRSTEKRSDRDVHSRPNRRQSPQAESDRDSHIEDYESYKGTQSIRKIKEEQVSPSHEFRSPERRSGCKHQNIEDSESCESTWRSTEKRSNRDVPSRPNRRQSPQDESDRDSHIEDYESYKRSQSIRKIKEEQVSPSHEFRSPERRTGCKHINIEDSESYEGSWRSTEKRSDRNVPSRPNRRQSPQAKSDRDSHIEDYESCKGTQSIREIKEEQVSPSHEFRSPERRSGCKHQNIEDSESCESTWRSTEKRSNRDVPSRPNRRQSPQDESDRDSHIEDYESYKRSQSIREIKEEQVSPSHEFRSPERRSGCKHQNIEDSESCESIWPSTEKRSDRDVPSRPNRGSPQSRSDYEDREIMEAIWSLLERSDQSRALSPDRRSPQPKIDSRTRNIEGSETNERSRSSREETDDLNRSLKSERRSPQPMKVYTPRNIEGSETNERSRSSREEKDDLDGSLRPDRKSPQPSRDQDYTPRNIEGSETNPLNQTNREELDVLDKSLRPDRKSPQPRRDYTPRNIEGSETNQMSQINREERDVLDKSLRPDRKSPQPRRGFRPQKEEDVRDGFPRLHRRSPQPSRNIRPRIIESYETTRIRRERLIDRNRPRLNRPSPVRSGFRRENIQDSHARFQDRRREGPGTWNRGDQRPRERDGHVRDRSPVPSRSTANPREIRRPDMRPRR
ncbi:uncharacterized protein LOC134752762 [Cydia strobilella]|uniref:uncharacterized protein LOC134752762 n=1 Tax=Cydia strobilella TaxID=1100964 RepID=UPI00300400AF